MTFDQCWWDGMRWTNCQRLFFVCFCLEMSMVSFYWHLLTVRTFNFTSLVMIILLLTRLLFYSTGKSLANSGSSCIFFKIVSTAYRMLFIAHLQKHVNMWVRIIGQLQGRWGEMDNSTGKNQHKRNKIANLSSWIVFLFLILIFISIKIFNCVHLLHKLDMDEIWIKNIYY